MPPWQLLAWKAITRLFQHQRSLIICIRITLKSLQQFHPPTPSHSITHKNLTGSLRLRWGMVKWVMWHSSGVLEETRGRRGGGGGELCHRDFHNQHKKQHLGYYCCVDGLLERECCTMLWTAKVGFLCSHSVCCASLSPKLYPLCSAHCFRALNQSSFNPQDVCTHLSSRAVVTFLIVVCLKQVRDLNGK